MECTVSWTGGAGTRSGMGFLAETGSGHTLMMDGAPDAVKPENGGQNLAPRPMETFLAGAGGCTAYDVVLILKRGRHDVRGCSVKLQADRAEVDPRGEGRRAQANQDDNQGDRRMQRGDGQRRPGRGSALAEDHQARVTNGAGCPERGGEQDALALPRADHQRERGEHHRSGPDRPAREPLSEQQR